MTGRKKKGELTPTQRNRKKWKRVGKVFEEANNESMRILGISFINIFFVFTRTASLFLRVSQI